MLYTDTENTKTSNQGNIWSQNITQESLKFSTYLQLSKLTLLLYDASSSVFWNISSERRIAIAG